MYNASSMYKYIISEEVPDPNILLTNLRGEIESILAMEVEQRHQLLFKFSLKIEYTRNHNGVDQTAKG